VTEGFACGTAPESGPPTASRPGKPKLRYSAGKQSGQVRALHRFMPERWVDSILRKFNEFPSEQV
jgi:hypothetical protein